MTRRDRRWFSWRLLTIDLIEGGFEKPAEAVRPWWGIAWPEFHHGIDGWRVYPFGVHLVARFLRFCYFWLAFGHSRRPDRLPGAIHERRVLKQILRDRYLTLRCLAEARLRDGEFLTAGNDYAAASAIAGVFNVIQRRARRARGWL